MAHGVVCRVLLASMLPDHTAADWPRLGPLPNIGLSKLVRAEGGEWSLVRLNEVLAAG